MLFDLNSDIPAGWKGKFAESKDAFAYPEPDLSSLPMLCNMDNIERIKRQLHVYWPEFSWESKKGDKSSRCFQRFAHDISSIGYDDTGRIWSIICPQQGVCTHNNLCMNVEITVTGQRGWVNETKGELAADMTVEAKIWFSSSSQQRWPLSVIWHIFKTKSLPFPSDKANAIKVSTHLPGNTEQPIFPIRNGLSSLFEAPPFAQHPDAWGSGHIEVEIGDIVTTNHPKVDEFNRKILDIFNIASGNMLQSGNILTWNLWFHKPALVDTEEWRTHAERWRKSIDIEHGHNSAPAMCADGSLFKPEHHYLKEFWDIVKIGEDITFSR